MSLHTAGRTRLLMASDWAALLKLGVAQLVAPAAAME